MRLVTKALIATFALAATVAVAADATDPAVKARQELMGVIGGSMKVLGDMAGGKTAFDATAAEAAKAAIIAASAGAPAAFAPQATDPKTKAKPEIWGNLADFNAKAGALNTAATGMDATTVEGVQAGIGAMGETCKACHGAYRS